MTNTGNHLPGEENDPEWQDPKIDFLDIDRDKDGNLKAGLSGRDDVSINQAMHGSPDKKVPKKAGIDAVAKETKENINAVTPGDEGSNADRYEVPVDEDGFVVRDPKDNRTIID